MAGREGYWREYEIVEGYESSARATIYRDNCEIPRTVVGGTYACLKAEIGEPGWSKPKEHTFGGAPRRLLTGVMSRSESASVEVTDPTASSKAPHLRPLGAIAAVPGGSAEKAFRPSILNRLWSFDLVLSCRRWFCVMEDFRGLTGFSRFMESFLCKGGNVDERADGGE